MKKILILIALLISLNIQGQKKSVNKDLDACNCVKEFELPSGRTSYFPLLKQMHTFEEFTNMLSPHFAINQKEFKKLRYRKYINEHSRHGDTRFEGFDLINYKKKFGLYLTNYSNTQLLIMPCLNKGEIGSREVYIDTRHPIYRYQQDFDEEEGFDFSSKQMYELLIAMTDFEIANFISETHDKEKLNELLNFLKSKNDIIPDDSDFNKQIEIIQEFYDNKENLNYDEGTDFFSLFFEKEFNHGILIEKENKKGYDAFDNAVNNYFYPFIGDISIETLVEEIISKKYTFTIGKGRYAFKSPLFIIKDSISPVYFNCNNINAKKKLAFSDVSGMSITKNTHLKETKIIIDSIVNLAFIEDFESTKGAIALKIRGNYKIKRKTHILTVLLVIVNDKAEIKIRTNDLDTKVIEKITKEIKGVYSEVEHIISFERKL